MSQHFECRGGDDAAAYALGALDSHELPGFQRHLQTCSVCQAEVQSVQQLTNVMAEAAPQYPAPRALRRRVMTDVRADVARQRAAREFSRTAPAGRRAGDFHLGGLRLGRGLGQLVGPPRRAGIVGALTALVLVVVVVLAGLTASGSRQRSRTSVYQASVGRASVYVSAGHGELIVHQLKQLGSAQTYEVWEEGASGVPEPTRALFNTSSSGDTAVNVPGSMTGVKRILVTREKAGGAAVPSGKPLVVASIS